jgi:hypothetical protein
MKMPNKQAVSVSFAPDCLETSLWLFLLQKAASMLSGFLPSKY